MSAVRADIQPSDVLENELISRWRRVITSLPRGTMGRHCGYSGKQLEYLSLVVREVLKVKNVVLQVNHISVLFLSTINYTSFVFFFHL